MKTPVLTASLAGAIFMSAAWPSVAQAQACNDRDDVLAHLAKKYHEAPVAMGVTNTGGLVEVLATPDGGTWTIIITLPNGTSCLVAAGEGWRAVEAVRPGA